MSQSTLPHVLLVDDEDSFRLSIEMALKMSNDFIVQSCDSGQSAVEILKKEAFDVILLDYRMSEMSGLDVMEWMHSQKILTPVILVTAAGSETVAIEAMKLGAYDYIRKDQLDIDRLSLAVKSAHERYLYRKQMLDRQAEERMLQEKQQELDSLQMFHSTVNSVGQLVERSLADLSASLARFEKELLKAVKEGNEAQCTMVFKEVKQGIDIVASGVGSMRNLSTMVTRKLDDIHIAPGHHLD
jgi:DNA-binding NarL/FixJ family response regulator